jgi:hypothetical protein
MNKMEKLPKDFMLTLTIQREYFIEILFGDKKIEYRDKKPYYDRLLLNKEQTHYRPYQYLRLRNGYNQGVPELIVEINKIEETDTEYWIHLGDVVGLSYADQIIEYLKSLGITRKSLIKYLKDLEKMGEAETAAEAETE